jgi:NitT/TauT family transport system substrate-binding protein
MWSRISGSLFSKWFVLLIIFLFNFHGIFPPNSSGQPAQKTRKVIFATPGLAMSSLPLILARNQGFYRREGLDVDFVVMQPGLTIPAVITGDAQFAVPFSLATRAAIAGAPIRLVMGHMTATDGVLVVHPSIRRAEDLRGKTIAVSAPGALIDVASRLILRKYGLVPDIDTKILSLAGGTPLRFTALKSGKVDAVLLSLPHSKMAVQDGFKELVFLKDFIMNPFNGFSTNLKTIQSDREVIVKTIRATLRGMLFVKENKEESLRVMGTEFGLTDRELANMVYDEALSLYMWTGVPSEASMKADIDSAKEVQKITRQISVSDVADWSFAREAYKTIR